MPGANYEQPEITQLQELHVTENQTNVVREITLTDRLNKKLLEAYLQKINQSGDQYTSTEENQQSDDSINNDFS